MKATKIIITLLCCAVLVLSLGACSSKSSLKGEFNPANQKPSDNLDILTSGEWEYDFDDCAYVLNMYEDGDFSNYCACGSPAGYSDLIEYYIYDDESKTIYLYDYEKQYHSTAKVHDISETEVTIEKYGEMCHYVRVD